MRRGKICPCATSCAGVAGVELLPPVRFVERRPLRPPDSRQPPPPLVFRPSGWDQAQQNRARTWVSALRLVGIVRLMMLSLVVMSVLKGLLMGMLGRVRRV